MKLRLGIQLAGIAVLAMIFCAWFSPVAVAEPIKLSYANFPPAPTFPCVQMERWKQEVEKRTNGKVVVNTYPGGTLLDAKSIIDGVTNGIADIGNLCMAYQPGRFPVTNATSLPLNIPDSKVGSMVLWEMWKKFQPKEFEKVKVLAMFTTATTNIMSTFPIKTLDEIKGVSLRASGGAAEILSAWDANAVGMPMPATVEALQKGVVKGLFSSLEVMKDLKFAESCKYVTMTDTVVYPFAVVMNQKKWDGLPADVKKVFEDLMEDQVKWTGNYMDEHIKEAMDWSVNDQKVQVISLSKEEKAAWNAKLEKLTSNWIAEATKNGLPAEAIIQEVKALIKKHSTM